MVRTSCTLILFGLIYFSMSPNVTAQRVRADQAQNTANISNRVLKSVALIKTYTESGEPLALGSGFAIAPDIIITNLHVFKRAFSATTKFTGSNTEQKVTEVVGFDLANDLCAVRISKGNSVPLLVGSTTALQITDEVFAFGNPEGLEGTVSKGIVSSLRRLNGLIQIDAAISPGSSGGPVTNKKGEVVGVVVSTIMNGQNLNFAIPADKVTRLDRSNHFQLLFAGSMAVSDRETEGLHGSVTGYTESYIDYLSDSRKKVVAVKVRYDEVGNLLERTLYSWTSGEWLSTRINTYDSAGFLTRQVLRKAGDAETITDFSRKDAIEKRIRERQFSNVLAENDQKVTYDDRGREIERAYDGEDAYTSQPYKMRYINRFGAYGFITQSLAYRDRGGRESANPESIHTYRYTFDSMGNWIQRIDTINVLLEPQPRQPLTTRAVYRDYDYQIYR